MALIKPIQERMERMKHIKISASLVLITTALHSVEVHYDLLHLENPNYTDYLPRISPITDSSAAATVKMFTFSV